MVKRIYKLTKNALEPPGLTDSYLGYVETGRGIERDSKIITKEVCSPTCDIQR